MKASEFYDTAIYSDRGNYVGEVQEVVLDLDEGSVLGLGFGKREGTVTTIPYESVKAIGEIIIVQSGRTKKSITEESEPEE